MPRAASTPFNTYRPPEPAPHTMPGWSAAENARRAKRKALRLEPDAPRVPSEPCFTVCPTPSREVVLPPGYVSQLNPADCRPWAAAATTRGEPDEAPRQRR